MTMSNCVFLIWYFLLQNGAPLAQKQTIHFFTNDYVLIQSLQMEGRSSLAKKEIPEQAVHCLINLQGDIAGHLYQNCKEFSLDSLDILPAKNSLVQLKVQLKGKKRGQFLLSAKEPVDVPSPLYGYLRRLNKEEQTLGDYALSSLEKSRTSFFVPGTYNWWFLTMVGLGNESTPKIKVKFIPQKGKRQKLHDRQLMLTQDGTLKVRVR